MHKKRKIFLLLAIIVMTTFVNAQDRSIARGALPGELYMTRGWYGIYSPGWGPPVFDTLLKALYHITDHGKKVEITYAADVFIQDEEYPYFDSTVTVPGYIMSDATSGVIYNKDQRYSSDLNYWIQSLWVSFDYGQTWAFREVNPWPIYYYTSNFEGLIYKTQYLGYDGNAIFQSTNYGETWQKIGNRQYLFGRECGWNSCEVLGVISDYSYTGNLYYTNDWFETYSVIPIDSQYLYGNMSGIFPDAFRGALPGEVYVSSWFPDWTYKISFSADTGQTFRVVYHSDSIDFLGDDDKSLNFMSDREAGVFHITCSELVETDEPWGMYTKICVSHYRDYGETLVGTYCHDFMINYPESCAGVLDMEAEVDDKNNVWLQWHIPETETLPIAYRVYRNDTLLIELPQTTYFDENLPNGDYVYFVRAVYADGCESLSYNIVKVVIDFTEGIGEMEKGDGIVVYPNPTDGQLTVSLPNPSKGGAYKAWEVKNIEVFDVFGRLCHVETHGRASLQQPTTTINISHLPSGVYFIRIQTENSVVTKKVVKQ